MIERVISGGREITQDAKQRFADKVWFGEPDDCWNWQACLASKGYGFFRVSPTWKINAHRFAYLIWVGPIPDNCVLDHKCRNPTCVNPSHLEPVSSAENQRRGNVNQCSGVLYCSKGHAYSPENTYRWSCGKTGRSLRACRICRNENVARYRTRKGESHND